MPFNGSGSYTRDGGTTNWQDDAAAGTKIRADLHDQHDQDIANALGNVICRDGQSSISADIPFNGKKITNLGAPVASTDAATKTYVDNSTGRARISDAPPPSPVAGDLWWESDSGNLYCYYNDGDSLQWVQTNTPSTNASAHISSIVQTVVTSSGTYTKPVGLKFLEVTVIGAGGGAPDTPTSASGQSSAVGGGGGGGSVIKFYAAANVPASVPMTVGAFSGVFGAGGTSLFAGLSAGGGGGATTAVAGTSPLVAGGGSGGTASGGDLNIGGGQGDAGIRCAHGSATTWQGGGGGGTLLSQKGPLRMGGGVGGGISAVPLGYGGGGSGGGNGGVQSPQIGGAGGNGVIVLREYF
jgi:hypothetical protein